MTWRPDGKAGPQRKRTVQCTKLEAEQFLLSQAATRSRVKAGLASAMRWDELLPLYVERLQAKGRGAGYIEKVQRLLHACRDCVLVEVSDVSPALLEDWVNALAFDAQAKEAARAAKLQRDTHRGWANTANKKRKMVGAFFKWAFRKARQLSPLDAVDFIDESKKPPRDITPDEYAAVWNASEESVQDLMDVYLVTGCRFSELASMRRASVQPDGRWVAGNRKGKDFVKQTFPPELLEIILKQPLHADGLVWHKWARPFPASNKGITFLTGVKIDPFWFRKVLHARCDRAKVARFKPHDLRHAAGSWCDDAGANTRQIQKLLGHSRVETTELYAHGTKKGDTKVLQDMILKMRNEALKRLIW